MNWARHLLQIPAYAAFAAFIGYFSSAPYRHLEPGRAVLKLSFSHAGERKAACHTRSAEELAKLAPNMRAPEDCPRERSDVLVEVEMDGQPLYRITAPPGGLRGDLPATVFRRLEIPAGQHRFRARLADRADGAFRYSAEKVIDVAQGRVVVIDFVAPQGFVFHA